jgi:hypothetical protein
MVDSSFHENPKPWYFWVDEKRRHNLFQVLKELSGIQRKPDPQFILIGALALLIRGVLQYMVQWDADLLFRNEEALSSFVALEKSRGLRIVHYDEHLMRGKEIASLHTAWSFDGTWFNVDYILKPKTFELYHSTACNEGPFEQCVNYQGSSYGLDLFMAHPWDIFIEKVLSPRFQRELENRDWMSVDIRHVVTILEREKGNDDFWQTAHTKIGLLGKKPVFKSRLLGLVSSLPELGYGSVDMPERLHERIRDF